MKPYVSDKCEHNLPMDACSRCRSQHPPTDTSWITFEPAPRSLWSRIRRLWRRDGITKREADVVKESFLDAQGTPATVLADDKIRLKDVSRLDLKPGDTLVVTLAGDPSAKDAHEAKRRILAILGDQIDEHHLLVIPETAKVSVLRTDGHPLAQWELELLARQPTDGDQP